MFDRLVEAAPDEAGLIKGEPRAAWVYYRVHSEALASVLVPEASDTMPLELDCS